MLIRKALVWAMLIVGISCATELGGLSDSVQFAVLAGLSGATVAGLSRRPRACGGL